MDDVNRDVLGAFGERLRAARDRAGLSQEALAQATREATGGETTQATVSRWESGKHPPTLREIATLAQVLGVRVSDLVDDRPEDENVAALRDIHRRAAVALGLNSRPGAPPDPPPEGVLTVKPRPSQKGTKSGTEEA